MPDKHEIIHINATLTQVAVVISVIVFCSTVLVALICQAQSYLNDELDVYVCKDILQQYYEEKIKERLK